MTMQMPLEEDPAPAAATDVDDTFEYLVGQVYWELVFPAETEAVARRLVNRLCGRLHIMLSDIHPPAPGRPLVEWQRQFIAVQAQLVAALSDAWDFADQPAGGANLPEQLRLALQELARRKGGSEELVKHRPGCWEAGHVLSLAARADWDS